MQSNWKVAFVAGVAAVTLAVSTPAFAQPAGPVSTTPATGTPALANSERPQHLRQLAQCGPTMYAVGTFTTITRRARRTRGTTPSASVRSRRTR